MAVMPVALMGVPVNDDHPGWRLRDDDALAHDRGRRRPNADAEMHRGWGRYGHVDVDRGSGDDGAAVNTGRRGYEIGARGRRGDRHVDDGTSILNGPISLVDDAVALPLTGKYGVGWP